MWLALQMEAGKPLETQSSPLTPERMISGPLSMEEDFVVKTNALAPTDPAFQRLS